LRGSMGLVALGNATGTLRWLQYTFTVFPPASGGSKTYWVSRAAPGSPNTARFRRALRLVLTPPGVRGNRCAREAGSTGGREPAGRRDPAAGRGVSGGVASAAAELHLGAHLRHRRRGTEAQRKARSRGCTSTAHRRRAPHWRDAPAPPPPRCPPPSQPQLHLSAHRHASREIRWGSVGRRRSRHRPRVRELRHHRPRRHQASPAL
jgi:hypothetical protein